MGCNSHLPWGAAYLSLLPMVNIEALIYLPSAISAL